MTKTAEHSMKKNSGKSAFHIFIQINQRIDLLPHRTLLCPFFLVLVSGGSFNVLSAA